MSSPRSDTPRTAHDRAAVPRSSAACTTSTSGLPEAVGSSCPSSLGRGPGSSAYGAAKGGMLSFSRHLATELGPHHVRVNCVSPGFMRTPMSTGERQGLTGEQTEARMAMFAGYAPLGRAGSVDDIANAILFLASEEASFITGQEIVVDGGWMVRGPSNIGELIAPKD